MILKLPSILMKIIMKYQATLVKNEVIMAKEDIIEKFKKEKIDEGELFQEKKADEVSLLVFMSIVVVTMLFNRDVKVFALTIGMFLLAIGAGDIYRYIKLKSKKELIKGLFEIIFGALLYLCFVFLTKGWI